MGHTWFWKNPNHSIFCELFFMPVIFGQSSIIIVKNHHKWFTIHILWPIMTSLCYKITASNHSARAQVFKTGYGLINLVMCRRFPLGTKPERINTGLSGWLFSPGISPISPPGHKRLLHVPSYLLSSSPGTFSSLILRHLDILRFSLICYITLYT